MPLHHYLPASYLALFSTDLVTMPSRSRKIAVGDKSSGRIFESLASKVGAINNLYTVAETTSDPQQVDQTWGEYEKALPAAISSLIDGSLDIETWARILVPFVACMLVRGPDFDTRFTRRLLYKGVPATHIASPDNINHARLMELQRLLGPVTAAKWKVLSVTGEENLITNDLGYTPFENKSTHDIGMAIPLGLRHILAIVPQTERVIAIAEEDIWRPVIDYEELPRNNHLTFNSAIALNSQRYLFGPDKETLVHYIHERPRASISPEPVQLGFIDGTQALAHEFTWHRFVSAIRKPPSTQDEWEFPLDWQGVKDGWYPPVILPVNLGGFPPALERHKDQIRVKFYDADMYFKFSMALMLQQTGHLDEFVAECGKILPSVTDKALRVKILIERGGVRADLGDYEGGLADLSQAVAESPLNAHAHCDLGYCLTKSGKSKDAIREFSKAIELDPNLGVAYLDRGQVYAETNRLRKALKDFNTAIRLLPDGPAKAGAIRNRAELRIKEDNYVEAVQDFDLAIQLYLDAKDQSYCLYRRGIAHLLLKELPNALIDINKSFELADPTFNQLRVRGQIHSELKKHTNALKDFGDAIRLATNSIDKSDILEESAGVLAELMRYGDALSQLNDAIELMPESASLYYNKGYVLLLTAEFDDALEAFDRAIALRPKYARAFNDQGIAFGFLAHPKDAIDSFQKAIAAEPDNEDRVSALRNMALAEASLGNYDEADQIMMQVDELAPEAMRTLVAKGRLEVLRENYDEALRWQSLAENTLEKVPNFYKAIPLLAKGQDEAGLALFKEFLKGRLIPVEVANLLHDLDVIHGKLAPSDAISEAIALLSARVNRSMKRSKRRRKGRSLK